jgi:hypothetical protein
MTWIEKKLKSIIYIAFLVPILLVAFVSISHVTKWYGISNPTSWSIYLSVAVEIAALSTLAAIAAKMGSKVYFPFAVVTIIQFIGNVFFAYQFIEIDSKSFKDWVDLVSPLVQYMGVENGDFVGHKRFLAFFSGGMLPIISLSFLHMLVKFEEEEKNKSSVKIDDSVENKELPVVESVETNSSVEVDNSVDEVPVIESVEVDESPVIELSELPEKNDSIIIEPYNVEDLKDDVVDKEDPPVGTKKVLTYLKRDGRD